MRCPTDSPTSLLAPVELERRHSISFFCCQFHSNTMDAAHMMPPAEDFLSAPATSLSTAGLSVVGFMMAMTLTEQFQRSLRAIHLALQLLSMPLARKFFLFLFFSSLF
ncbi:hypothetical protein QBC42DRAFT_21927 [Cladorrhinum samala]|uniref:Uncharacterized protein n=1 Tax=Cladorrhinum samala TaxID=585594 RepID=A0AAV9HZM8_9PEZI|nr:hypothetical protein QBC42DRAFT_21927 [Cladorrhinum samala]